MKEVVIEWKHLEKNKKTCNRCSSTGENLKQVIDELNPILSKNGYTLKLVVTKLVEEEMPESNSIFIDGVSIESILKATVSENNCDSCGDLIKGKCDCRTVTVDNETFEAIPKELIKEAIFKALNLESIINLKENTMNIQVLGSGCPTCKKLFEITKQAVKELNLNEEVEYITDVTKIIEMGIMTSPVLAVKGKAVMTGFTPDINKIKTAISNGILIANQPKGSSC